MGENVQLLHMKNYAMTALSQNGSTRSSTTASHNQNGGSNLTANGTSKSVYQNGYQGDRGYGDWDSSVTPPITPTSPTSPASMTDSHSPMSPPAGLPPQRQQLSSRPSSASARSKPKFIPEHEIEIPKDGSLHGFNADDMSTFLRYLGVEERIVTHVHKKGLDGAKFSKLKDSDLEALSMKNPIICHFRDKSSKDKGGKKKKIPFML